MTKKELFEWAIENMHIYPELELLCESTVDGEEFINLEVQYGQYKEQYYYIDENRTEKIKNSKTVDELLCGNKTVEFLRGCGNSVAVVENYEAVQTLILECVENLQKKKKAKKYRNKK